MTLPGYPAARTAALRVHPHFERHLKGTQLLPDVETMQSIIDVAFWASLRREEIYTPRVSLAYVAPSEIEMQIVFERPVPLASQPLTRLGPAVERPGIHLCVRRVEGDLVVWGAARKLPRFCFVLEVVAPGLLVIKRGRGDDSGKFINLAVLQGDEVKVIKQQETSLSGSGPGSATDGVNVLIQLAVSMRAHGRGGSMLVVPAGSSEWRDSLVQPILYAVDPPFRALADLMSEDHSARERRRWQEALHRLVDEVAGLTAVDGATVISDQYELLAFGAKIVRRPRWEQVSRVVLTEPIEGSGSSIAEPGQLGGTRHFSAAQFAHDQRDSTALVASQDGRFTVFGWSAVEAMVYANRIETLLL
jgi:hypothetical protein